MTPVYERYAEALHRAADALGCSGAVARELPEIEGLVLQCSGYLNNPLIGTDAMVAILREFLSGKVSPLTLEFILFMTSSRHLRYYHDTMTRFLYLSGFEKAVVRLRVPFQLDQNTMDQLKSRLKMEKLIPEEAEDAELLVVEDKELIGGFIASCGGYQIDTSLRTAIMRLLRPERLV